jgi:hypothetical protein
MKNWQSNISDDTRTAMYEKQKATNIERYGCENVVHCDAIKEKITKTNNKRYGASYPFQSEVIKHQIKESNNLKYGVDFPFQCEDIIDKSKTTTIKRYGSLMSHARTALDELYEGKNPFEIIENKEKIKKTLIEKYGRQSPKHIHLSDSQLSILHDIDEFSGFIQDKTLTIAAYELGVDATTIARYCDYYNTRHLLTSNKSILEFKIAELLTDLGVKYIQNDKKIIRPFEIDFYLPDFNVGIEVGSIFWHSELNGGRGKNYHHSKWQKCKELNIDLYQWLDVDILNKWYIIESKIKYITKNIKNIIGARKLTIQKITVKEERPFLDSNHIQGFSKDRNSQYVFGAYYDNELMAVMTFKDSSKYIELKRYATNIHSIFPGLFSKMVKYAESHLPIQKQILSFSDNNHSNGNVYLVNNFVISHNVEPRYKYTKNYHQLLGRKQFTQQKLLKKHPKYDKSMTEWEIMQMLGYDRIWDSGKIAWILKR